MIGYVCYPDRFAGSLRGVRQHLDYLAELGVTYLHLMPLLRPRDGDNDGGYAVADYGAVDRRVGSVADLEALAAGLHDRGIALCIDLVLNHTAREHEWARKAQAGDPACREMYLIYPDRVTPDAYGATLPEVFGAHDRYQPECDLAYDNQLMVMLWSTLATRDVRLAEHALARRRPAPAPTAWVC
ncbi:MAG: alpha-amylase family glycosyl hydrolase [Streptosporangiaceae bacterium]